VRVRPLLIGLVAIGSAAGVAAVRLARLAEAVYPPVGTFVALPGGRLRYVERGAGPPVVVVPGDLNTIEFALASPLVDLLARQFCVLVVTHATRVPA
jgi:hypothetical protein